MPVEKMIYILSKSSLWEIFIEKILLNVSAIKKVEQQIFKSTSKYSIELKFEFYCLYFRWFEGFSWEFLKKGTLTAPYVPKVNKSKFLFIFCLIEL